MIYITLYGVGQNREYIYQPLTSNTHSFLHSYTNTALLPHLDSRQHNGYRNSLRKLYQAYHHAHKDVSAAITFLINRKLKLNARDGEVHTQEQQRGSVKEEDESCLLLPILWHFHRREWDSLYFVPSTCHDLSHFPSKYYEHIYEEDFTGYLLYYFDIIKWS